MSDDAARGMVTMCRWLGLPDPVTEHVFASGRKYRFDLCWPDKRVAMEVDGGTWTGGRHVTGSGVEADCEKFSLAAALGWRVLRVTPRQVEDGRAAAWLRAALEWSPET